MLEFSDEEAIEFIRLTKQARQALKDVLKVEKVFLYQNEDTHHNFHLWMLPRLPWTKEFPSRVESIRKIMDYAKGNMATNQVQQEIKEAIDKMREYLEKSCEIPKNIS